METEKYGINIPVSLLQGESLIAAQPTPEQRAEWQRTREACRAEQRVDINTAEDVIVGLARHFGWSQDYVVHLAQPYCDCDWDRDGGWDYCSHAYDEGLAG
jgi:hypothetical protein